MKNKKIITLFISILIFFSISSRQEKIEKKSILKPSLIVAEKKQKHEISSHQNRSPASAIVPGGSQESLTDLLPNDQKMLEKSLSIYKEQGMYQFKTQPLDEMTTVNPILRHYRQPTLWSGSIEGNNLRARIIADKDYYTNEKEAILYLEYEYKGPPEEILIEAELLKTNHELINSLQFSLDANNQWKTTIDLNFLPDDIYLTQVRIKKGNETVHLVKTFSLQKTSPLFININKSQIKNGDLEFSSNWHIKKEGYYLIEAVLTNEKGEAIAAYEEALKLPTGDKNILINFDGFLFFQKKYQGKFKLEQITLSLLGDALEIKRGPLVEPHFQTQFLSWKDFRSFPNPDPSIQEKIKILEAKLSSR